VKKIIELPGPFKRLPVRYRVGVLLCFLCSAPIGTAFAASLYVKALGYNNAEVVINESAPITLWVGETSPDGVKLHSVEEDSAVFEIDGKRWTLKARQGTYSQASLKADQHGQFFLMAKVNGTPIAAMIDTGATTVSMNSEDATRLGIDYLLAPRAVANTANGPVTAYRVTFESVEVGEIVLRNVQGAIVEGDRTVLPLVLIGMSFLRQVEMQRSGDTMQLLKRYY
jgi:aspartyl protease family protein